MKVVSIAGGRHTLNNLLQSIQTRDRPINLPARMIAHHNAIETSLYRHLRILNTLNAHETKQVSTAKFLPQLHCPDRFIPRMRSSMPHVIDPQRTRLVVRSLGVDAAFFQTFLKYGVRQTEIRASAMVKSVVRCCYVVVAPAELPGIEGEYASCEIAVDSA